MWAYVRKVGAIGKFSLIHFNDVCTKDAWFEKYSKDWELHHFVEQNEPKIYGIDGIYSDLQRFFG